MALRAVNPATGEALETYDELDERAIDAALEGAATAFGPWRAASFAERAGILRTTAGLLRDEKREHARRMALEMGKPVTQGEGEAEKCAWVCEYYAEHAEAFLSPQPAESDATRSYVRFDPIGPVLAVMPWNFPYWQVFRFAAPALMAGNVGLLKHASNVPACALAIEDVLRRAGLPDGVFQSLLISSKPVAGIIADPRLRAVTLTGSEGAGAEVGASAGRALKKSVLELGGSDPFIVLDDVDVASVAKSAARARTINAGQSCIAAKRFLVQEGVADAFVEAFAAELDALRVGDPLDAETQVGPLAREDLVDDLHRQVERSLTDGARLVTGGERMDGAGYYYRPTLLDRVEAAMPVAAEETFGPAAAVLRVGSDAEAVATANRSPYGLGASVWSGDTERAERLAPEIESGHVAVNGIVKSDPRLPFGGVKQSGYGRELAEFGIREFANVKTVWVGPAA